ncbi:S-layer homology domain-containing protein [Tissierella sp. MSJ-40]|uniref:S-layer homology domain-containing protein n=1 Tax=Tissierella simiarum TaxID=2841534 RepID=A0ABS6E5J8_9FIRM|nr:S-layer homology domain-containing protein [Tissierella simiarum]MBU5437514.1 S-layer homology domain-containing protein [Tissierella simiarum]
MIKKYRIIYILILIILTSTSKIAFSETLEEKYVQGRTEGDQLGYYGGRIKGLQNSSSKVTISDYEARPKDTEILKNYESYLVGKDSIYKNYFLLGFYEGFARGYNETITSNPNTIYSKQEKINYADVLGLILGEIYGYRDFYNKTKSNYYKAMPTEKDIIDMFNLNMEVSSYKNNFIRIFKEKFREGYEIGYAKGNMDPIKESYDAGIKDGDNLGEILGNIYGAKDYYENKTSVYTRDIPSDYEIQRNYSLNKDSTEYKDGFLVGFRKAYEKSYNASFRTANVNEKERESKGAYENGKEVGIVRGKAFAHTDYLNEDPNNWKKHKSISTEIIKEYNLVLYSSDYRQGFISGYWDGFSEGYNTTYLELSKNESSKKIVSSTIPISGGEVDSLDTSLRVKIEKGTYYNPVALSIDTISDNNFSLEDKYIKASNFYKLKVSNKSKNLNDKKLVEVRFEYYGNFNGGIYKLVDGKWYYIPSVIEDGFIKARIKPSSIKKDGNVYVVLIDNNNISLQDIRNHWAKDEIITYVKRNIISGYGNKLFKPDKNITRGEFLTILSKVYGWELPTNLDNVKVFKDFKSFEPMDKVISYSIEKGYISGYSDKTFKPNKAISYREVEIIMNRVLNSEDFKWYNVATKMLYDKQIRCKSYDSMDKEITRAEVTYMLYILNEWKY